MEIHIDKETTNYPDSYNTLTELYNLLGSVKLNQVDCKYRIKIDIEPIK